MKLPGVDGLGSVGLVGERKAVALLCLGFYTTLFFMIGLSARTELPEWVPVFVGMTVIYAVAFFAVGAEWFWGRWFATGVGYSGVWMTIWGFVATRSLPTPMIVFGVMHGLIALCLMGEKMAAVFDAKPAWREKWKLDDQGVLRVRRSVTRAASSLPGLIMFALAPREGSELLSGVSFDWTMVLLVGLAVAAMVGLLTSLRTWTIMTLAAVGVAVLCRSLSDSAMVWSAHSYLDPAGALPPATFHFLGAFAGLALVASSLPFARPMAKFLFSRR